MTEPSRVVNERSPERSTSGCLLCTATTYRWHSPMSATTRLDFVFNLADEQRAADEALVRALQGVSRIEGEAAHRWLLAKKREKMGASAFGFLRGSLVFFQGVLSAVRGLVADADERGWIVGDAHAENFGALRADRGAPWEKGEVRFWINDFDAVQKGRLVDDVLRLCTSAVLAGSAREPRADRALAWIEAALDGYSSNERVGPSPSVERLMKKVTHRTYEHFLQSRTERVASPSGPVHRFVRGGRYADLDRKEERALDAIVSRVDEHDEVFAAQGYEAFRVDDAAFRIAGNGSLGVLRAAVSIKPEKPEDPPWLFDVKAMSIRPESMREGRVALGAVDRAPSYIEAEGQWLLLRPLAPQEDKLAMEKVPTEEFEALFRFLGSVLSEAHQSGEGARRPRWTKEVRRGISRAVTALVAMHYAGFVGYANER